ncbi:hypothetical protein AMECASPLE_031724 [Ameca splendens]|uniref:Uncharacterized protein n=1 Tax=Ameca splendens TaxID=208324 RepID=A0ABV0ZSB1_9TELE
MEAQPHTFQDFKNLLIPQQTVRGLEETIRQQVWAAWQQRLEQNTIRQVVIMLRLSSSFGLYRSETTVRRKSISSYRFLWFMFFVTLYHRILSRFTVPPDID